MTVPTWQVRDLRRILRVSELRQHLRQARTDFRSTLSQFVYFNRSVVNPNAYDDEYLLSDQRLTYVYVDEVTACGFHKVPDKDFSKSRTPNSESSGQQIQ
ncbi:MULTISPECIES: RolB family protein [Rhizobium]|uniref:RolB family protein n=1 Tax=Rhizobium TaxID=379 RepID=UPI000DA9569B|nr:hypothetical protein [Rhizobium sp. L58/93]MBO9172020.1 hypothetical protein [Rhizobium sp. L245/93]MBO9187881.1 hypothetical protein [Rhizobium sp. E27B/91]QXZ87690.1 hypothetical protein J5287_27125 [Rhizobium sp. K1/93]QXZ93731.1 hypothetical protein J5280_27125 [Rhizobium sp. K15/93]QYA05227.1 hypothetical protein J5278_26885 [Rhizobium sp. B21/90]